MNSPERANDGIRLQVYLARAGVASRRHCEQIIDEGRVRVNGKVIREQGVRVSERDRVTLDGKPLFPTRKNIYLALHKPRRYLCASSDPEGRPLAIDLVAPAFRERLYTVGRLDFLSSGLILLTNDGQFAKAVSHPSSEVEKEYLVETRKPIPGDFLEAYRAGIDVNGERYTLKEFRYKNSRTVRLVLLEGKNREIRNVFSSQNIAVKRIHRVRVGIVSLKGILTGHFRALTGKEVRWFFDHSRSADPGAAGDNAPSGDGPRGSHGRRD